MTQNQLPQHPSWACTTVGQFLSLAEPPAHGFKAQRFQNSVTYSGDMEFTDFIRTWEFYPDGTYVRHEKTTEGGAGKEDTVSHLYFTGIYSVYKGLNALPVLPTPPINDESGGASGEKRDPDVRELGKAALDYAKVHWSSAKLLTDDKDEEDGSDEQDLISRLFVVMRPLGVGPGISSDLPINGAQNTQGPHLSLPEVFPVDLRTAKVLPACQTEAPKHEFEGLPPTQAHVQL